MKRAGFTVGPLIALVLVALALAMMLAGVAVFHLTAVQRSEANDQALYLAEGALSQTLSQLHQGIVAAETGGQQFGRQGETVTYAPYPERPDAKGVVTFATTASGYSTNNFDGTQNTGWNAIPVPSDTAHVIARGSFGDATRTVETFVSIPPYAFAVATEGDLTSAGPINARAEASMATLAQNVANGTPDTTLPANVGSNGAISAGSGTDVTGDVVGPASISLANPSTVGGAVRTSHIKVPTLSVKAYDNSALNVPTLGPNPPVVGILDIQAPTYAPQSVVVGGDLQIDSVILYVDGDLTVSGGISGTGSICVHGNVTVNGGANVSATNQVALLSTGNVTFNGPGSSKYFQGLVYCEGAFSTSNITVAGAMIVAPNPSEGTAGGTPSTLTLGAGTQVVFVPSVFNLATANLMSPMAQGSVVPTNPAPVRIIGRLTSDASLASGTVKTPPAAFSPNGVNDDTLPDATLLGSVIPAMTSADPGAASFFFPSQYDPYGHIISLNFSFAANDSTHVNLSGVAIQTPALPPPGAVVMVYQTIEYNPLTNRFESIPGATPVLQTYPNGTLTIPQADGALSSIMAGGATLNTHRLMAVMAAGQQAYMQAANQLLSQTPGVPNFYVNSFLDDTTPLSILSWQVQ